MLAQTLRSFILYPLDFKIWQGILAGEQRSEADNTVQTLKNDGLAREEADPWYTIPIRFQDLAWHLRL